jgi:hypothetical protein
VNDFFGSFTAKNIIDVGKKDCGRRFRFLCRKRDSRERGDTEDKKMHVYE